MRIVFLLRLVKNCPIGGHKMVYEYSNRLIGKGYDVTILYDCSNVARRWWIPQIVRHIYCKMKLCFYPNWFILDKKVKKKSLFHVSDTAIPEADVIIATSVKTAPLIAKIRKIKNKCYFIQDYENWEVSNKFVNSTYQLGLKNIVIAEWLKKIVDKYSNFPAIVVKNGIDFSVFDIDTDITTRYPYSIAMLYHEAPHKGSKYGIEGLIRLKEKYPQLKAHLFGTVKRPQELPDWIEYTFNANVVQLRRIYNNASIFLYNTIIEGYGLTGAEAMACGCMYVSSDYLGVHEYTTPDRNVVLYEPKNVDSLVEKLDKIFQDNDFRIKIATQGYIDIHEISWNTQLNLFEKALFADT